MDGERRRQQQQQDGVMGIVVVIAVFTFNSPKVQGQIVVTLS